MSVFQNSTTQIHARQRNEHFWLWPVTCPPQPEVQQVDSPWRLAPSSLSQSVRSVSGFTHGASEAPAETTSLASIYLEVGMLWQPDPPHTHTLYAHLLRSFSPTTRPVPPDFVFQVARRSSVPVSPARAPPFGCLFRVGVLGVPPPPGRFEVSTSSHSPPVTHNRWRRPCAPRTTATSRWRTSSERSSSVDLVGDQSFCVWHRRLNDNCWQTSTFFQ